MRIVFTGTDVLMLQKYPKQSLKRKYIYMFFLRLWLWFGDRFLVEYHYAVSDRLAREVKPLGLKKKVVTWQDPVLFTEKVEKVKTDFFTVLYYCPIQANKPLFDWVYGRDIFEELKKQFLGIEWLVIDGTQDMADVFPLVDLYIRPNRWDGGDPPRLVRECAANDIPVVWTYGGDPEVEYFRDQIIYHYEKPKKLQDLEV